MYRPTWILAFGLALLCTPTGAVPCGDDSCQEHEDRDDSSIRLKPAQPRDRSYDASRFLDDGLSPRLRNEDGHLRELRDDGRTREWRKRIAALVNSNQGEKKP